MDNFEFSKIHYGIDGSNIIERTVKIIKQVKKTIKLNQGWHTATISFRLDESGNLPLKSAKPLPSGGGCKDALDLFCLQPFS